jgi:hypothetical protein
MEHVGIVVDDRAAATEFFAGSDACCGARRPSKKVLISRCFQRAREDSNL